MRRKKVSLNQRPNGTWELRWRDGKHRSESWPKKADAERRRRQILYELNGPDTSTDDVSWEQFIDVYLEPHLATLRDATRAEYIQTLGYVNAELRPQEVGGITPHQIERWKAALSKHLARATVNKHLRHLRRFMQLAVKWGLRLDNPAKHVDMYSLPKKRIRVATADDMKALLAACDTDELRRFFRLAWCLGLRAGDLRKLAWDGVGLDARTLTHWDEKTQRDHIRPLPAEVVELLRKWPHRTGPLFPTLSPLSRRSFYERLAPVWERAQTDVRPHAFRRGLVSRLAVAHFHPSEIAGYTGQTEETILKAYTQIDDLRPVAEAIRLPPDLPPPPPEEPHEE